ncbi:hypothetical protein NQ038_14195 [Brevibacterium sp. 50QC2O2]|jgi:threonine/homoserine/homoserine lactone efflux protein|uniref:hypothetical protein n=1 Tax=Brevibacterium TaxID=1696 RepID=UPI00211C9564|nr:MULTISPECIES: hypothetical protein [unclassified Brevibacterium]MCQ9369055.1 hypothetical protein [Brevibacterium sp. 91QC2O2]MCQ9386887.1 hypothetical protein [Brevibacterium sp. 68QC2CO]MCQ9389783.1 hypothetical protein [Brevibacterium sp. 50QC2O2]
MKNLWSIIGAILALVIAWWLVGAIFSLMRLAFKGVIVVGVAVIVYFLIRALFTSNKR